MRWHLSFRADPLGRPIADNHYNRQNVGSKQFVPPGACVVLVIPGVALFVMSWPKAEYVKHDWAGAWVNSTFRNERGAEFRSSELIREAVAATLSVWPVPPPEGIITFVDEDKVKRKRDPGRCYLRAGFEQLFTYDYGADRRRAPRVTWSEGHLVFQMRPERMPSAEPPVGAQYQLEVA